MPPKVSDIADTLAGYTIGSNYGSLVRNNNANAQNPTNVALRQLSGKDPDYELLGQLGEGGFGRVAKVRRIRDSKVMACKSIDCAEHPILLEFAKREIDTWASFSDTEKYIAKFSRDCAWSPATETVRLYMDFYEGGDLQRVLNACKYEETTIHPFMVLAWALEITRGLKACHDRQIIHRDIKPQNILLSKPYQYNDLLWAASTEPARELTAAEANLAKDFNTWRRTRKPWCHITDFGLGKFTSAAIVSKKQTMTVLGAMGTPGYIAPESNCDNPKFSSKSDIYSLGCLFYNMATGKNPPSSATALLAREIPKVLRNYPTKFQETVFNCLQIDPSHRPTNLEVLNQVSDAYADYLSGDAFARLTEWLGGIKPPAAEPKADKEIELALKVIAFHRDLVIANQAGLKKDTTFIERIIRDHSFNDTECLSLVTMAYRDGVADWNTPAQRPILKRVKFEWILFYYHFHLAIEENRLALVKYMTGRIKAGQNRPFSTATLLLSLEYHPLHFAVRYLCEGTGVRMLEYLCQEFPDGFTAKSVGGRTPLHAAILYGHSKFVKVLLNADTKCKAAGVRDDNGNLPWNLLFNAKPPCLGMKDIPIEYWITLTPLHTGL